MTQHEIYMNMALAEAEQSLRNQLLPVGAVLVVDGKVVGRAHKEASHSYHLDHAEILLLREYFKGKNVKRGDHDIALYTTLEPCIMCLGTILHLPLVRLVYAAKDPYGGAESIMSNTESLPHRHKNDNLTIIPLVCEQQAKEQLRRFLDVNTHPFYKRQGKSISGVYSFLMDKKTLQKGRVIFHETFHAFLLSAILLFI